MTDAERPDTYVPIFRPTPVFLFRPARTYKSSDGSVLRQASSWIAWAGTSRWVLLRRTLGWLYRFPFTVIEQMRSHARSTRTALGRSLAGQLCDIVRVAARANVQPCDYYRYGLARYHGGTELNDYVSYQFFLAPAYAVTGQRVAAANSRQDFWSKQDFERHCRSHGFPCAQTIAVVTPDGVSDIYGKPVPASLPPGDLFTKPNRGAQGYGSAVFRWLGPDSYDDGKGGTLTAAALFELIRKSAAGAGWHAGNPSRFGIPCDQPESMVVQLALKNSASMASMVGNAFATLRIITLRDEHDDPEIVFCALRTGGTPDAIVDNFHGNGVAFPVDIETGRLRQGRIMNFFADPRFFTVHPVTGTQIDGWRLPQWDEAAQLALDLQKSYPELLLAGWDIGITPTGPCAVEVNAPPGTQIVQMERGFLGTRFSRLLEHHIAKWLDDQTG
ncbi:sugar-transfer associated ATP-grasp domain-containing protein [Oricola sp.]|uniref:sugar-transfer associated ATP-grasp domain-containing protein n=1 Tax=Oricola sp. TaxID=1979950 RepID=UPI003BA8CA66